MTPKTKSAPKSAPQSAPRAPSDTLVAEVRTTDGEPVGTLMLMGRTFSTGNTGYFGTGKLQVNGARYQAQAQLARIREK